MRGFLIRLISTGIAVLIASQIISGITIDTFASGLVGVLVLSFLNALVRPVLYLLSAPFIILTFGLFVVAINAFLLNVVAMVVTGFHVEGFWSAVGGALFISLVSTILNVCISDKGQVEVAISTHRPRKIRHIN